LVLCGTNGTGKSHCAKAIANWAMQNAIQLPLVATQDWFGLTRCRYIFWPEFCDEMKTTGDFDATVRLMEFNMLVLDDVGAEHDPTRFAMEKFYWLLERREFNWTVITTNVSPDLWDHKFERRVASRLLRNTEIIDLSDVPDFSTL
jgi:DNA replication protein DnaC